MFPDECMICLAASMTCIIWGMSVAIAFLIILLIRSQYFPCNPCTGFSIGQRMVVMFLPIATFRRHRV